VPAKKGGGLRWLGPVLCVAVCLAGCSRASGGNESSAPARNKVDTTTTPVEGGAATTTTSSSTATATASPRGLSLLVEPQAGMTPVYDLMSSARHSLDMTMYELSDPRAEQILIADHDRGVRVRVLLDHDESGASVNQAAYSALAHAGVPVAWANDSEIFHQKTITVDDAESAVMTGNLTPQYYAMTRDFVVMDSQPADVAGIETVFDSDWSGAAPIPGPPGTDLVWSPGSQTQIVALIGSATHSVVVENEEMDSTAIEDALEAVVQRGASATVIMTADSEWDSAFARLEAAGVHVLLYPDTSSALYIHAKVVDVDSATAFIGSENFSTASLDYNRELGLITSAAAVVGPLNSVLLDDALGGEAQGASAAPSPPTTTSPGGQTATSSTTASPTGCYPIDDEGGCYEPGEYCRDDDHGMTGRAGNGLTITCEYDDGWYWEP
jgi:cardiolipin synthase A/B